MAGRITQAAEQKEAAEWAYEGYCEAHGWVWPNGMRIPAWNALSMKERDAWRAAVTRAFQKGWRDARRI